MTLMTVKQKLFFKGSVIVFGNRCIKYYFIVRETRRYLIKLLFKSLCTIVFFMTLRSPTNLDVGSRLKDKV
jgi:hypothetical protein